MHAFSEYINSVLSGPGPDGKGGVAGLPLDPKTDDLFRVVAEGVLLCRLVSGWGWGGWGGDNIPDAHKEMGPQPRRGGGRAGTQARCPKAGLGEGEGY